MRLAGSEEGPEISYGTGSNANFSVSGVTALIFFLLPAATARQPANWQMCGSPKCRIEGGGGKGISVQSPRGLGVSQMIFSMMCGSPFPGGSSPRIPLQLNVFRGSAVEKPVPTSMIGSSLLALTRQGQQAS